MRRKPGTLIPIEISICVVAADLAVSGDPFHGYQIAKQLAEVADHRLLTAYGTLYRALARLEEMGLVASRREDPEIAARESRPGRRLYTLTAAGEAVAVSARQDAAAKARGKAAGRRTRKLVKA